MKIKNPGWKVKKYLILACLLAAFAFGTAAQAITSVTPANSVLNPVTQTLYAVDNSTPQIRVYTHSPDSGLRNYWDDAGNAPVALPAGSKCYGLAVSSDGTKLYISISARSSSEVRVYNLDSLGKPTGSPTSMTGAYWSTSSVPGGLSIAATRLFVVDQGVGRILVFDTTTNSFVTNITEEVAGKSNLYDVKSVFALFVIRLYVSRKTNPGEIYVYNYGGTPEHAVLVGKITRDLTYPTYLKFASNKLFVAVNGTDGVDIKVYQTNASTVDALVGNVKSGIVGSFGWTSFDVANDGSWLLFKKSGDASEVDNRIFKIQPSTISGGGDFTAEQIPREVLLPWGGTISKSDGLALSFNRGYAALSNSSSGTVQCVVTGLINLAPEIPGMAGGACSMKQYKLDRTTEIPERGETNERKVICKLPVFDTEGGLLTAMVRVRRTDTVPDGSWETITRSGVPSGTTAEITIPAGLFDNGQYEWQAKVRDSGGMESIWYSYGTMESTYDFIVNVTNNPPNAFSKIAPPNGAEQCCDVRLVWQNNGDPDAGDTLTYTVIVSQEGGGTVTGFPVTTREASYTIPMGTLTTGETYRWQVTASDSYGGTTPANGGTSWTFRYIDGIRIPGAPYITTTTPTNGATDVSTSAPVVITFSESMLSSSVMGALRHALPNPIYTWNSSNTVLTINHDPLAADTAYTVEVRATATDLDLEALNTVTPPSAPNPFSFTTGTGGVTTGEVTFSLYHVDEGNSNWVALPFTDTGLITTVDLGNAIAATFTALEGDNITITIWDPRTQTGQQTSGDFVSGGFIWDPVGGTPLAVGNMYAVSIYRANRAPGEVFTTNLRISGNSPADGSIALPLYHVDEGNLNWISIPWYTVGLNTTVDVGNSIATKFTPQEGDSITITIWDPATQTSQQTSGDFVGGVPIWDPISGSPIEKGKAYTVSVYRASRLPGEVFTFNWP